MLTHNTGVLYSRKSMDQTMGKIWQHPLTVVEAPMGYGKTTAVREYLKKCTDDVLWQPLTDDGVSGFWHGFSCLFKKLDLGCANRLAELGAPTNSILIEEAIEIIESLKIANRTVIVIDDYHLLSAGNVDHFFERLIKTAHPNLHIVIISRVMFGENTIELALKGYCYVINKSYFELTHGEIIEYYKLCGISLKPQEATALCTYTEGWISALYLCMLSLLLDGRVECQASLHELIEKVVYRYCSTEVQEFLLRTCIFDSFTLPQAKAVWHKDNAEDILSHLLAKNSFIKYDRVNKTYHIHNIFTSYLMEILGKQGVKSQQAIFQSAGIWYASIKDYIHAMDFFYKAADFGKLLATLETDKGNSLTNEHKEMLIRYFKDCPAEIKKEYTMACLIYAKRLHAFNEKDLFFQQCAEIRAYIKDNKELSAPEKDQVLGELEVLYSFTKYNDIGEMSVHHRKACELLKTPSQIIDKNGCWTFGVPSVLYMFHRKSGGLLAEIDEIIACMPSFYKITEGYGSGAEYVMQAEGYYHQGQFENAEIIAHKAMYMARSGRQIGIIICVMFLQIRLAFVKGDLSSVMNILRQMRTDIKEYGQYMFVHTADLCEAFIYSCLKQEKGIATWILTGDVEKSRLYFPSYAFFNIIYGKVLLVGGHHLKLIGIADQFIGIANIFPNLLGHVYTHIYVATAQYRLKHYLEARLALKQAIDIAAPDQLIMPFVENGEDMINVLVEIENSGDYVEFIGKVRAVYAGFSNKVAAMRTVGKSSDIRSKLTARELEIAELVSTGLSNHMIAESLTIAEVTVKKALQNIYVKLSISSRTVLARIMLEKN